MSIVVTFEPSGRTAVVAPGTTLYDAARGAGLPVGSSCRAEGICGQCGLTVLAGAENLSRESADEARVKRENDVSPGDRLSCCAEVHGPVRARASYW